MGMFNEDYEWLGIVRIFKMTFFTIKFKDRMNDVITDCISCDIITF